MADPNAPAAPNQFDVARQRALQQNNSDVQQQQEALQRRFASLGNLQSGAAIKQQQVVAEKGQENLANQNEGINAQEQAYNTGRQDIKDQQAFQASQQKSQQDFQAAQNAASLAQQANQFNVSSGLEKDKLAQSADEFTKTLGLQTSSETARETEAAGTLKLQNTQVANQADQFTKTLGLQTSTEAAREKEATIAANTAATQVGVASAAEKTGEKTLAFEQGKQSKQDIIDFNTQIANGMQSGQIDRDGLFTAMNPDTGKTYFVPADPSNTASVAKAAATNSKFGTTGPANAAGNVTGGAPTASTTIGTNAQGQTVNANGQFIMPPITFKGLTSANW